MTPDARFFLTISLLAAGASLIFGIAVGGHPWIAVPSFLTGFLFGALAPLLVKP